MIKMVKVIALKPKGGHRLWVKFSDDSEGVRDFGDVIAEGDDVVGHVQGLGPAQLHGRPQRPHGALHRDGRLFVRDRRPLRERIAGVHPRSSRGVKWEIPTGPGSQRGG